MGSPKLAEVFFMSRVHNLSTGIGCCDSLHMSLGKPWGGNAERCLFDGSENPKATWDGAKILFKKKNNLKWWVDPGFLVAINDIRGLTLKCATVFEDPMRIASVSWGLPGYFSPYYDDTTGKTTPGTPCTSCHNTDYMQDLSSDESCGELWLIVGETSNIFWNFHPEFSGKMKPFWRTFFQRGWFNHQLVHFRKS